MAALAIKQLQETEELGEPKGLDYSKVYARSSQTPHADEETSPFLSQMGERSSSSNSRRGKSPFQGHSPFVTK